MDEVRTGGASVRVRVLGLKIAVVVVVRWGLRRVIIGHIGVLRGSLAGERWGPFRDKGNSGGRGSSRGRSSIS